MTLRFEIAHQVGAFALELAAEVPHGVTAVFGPSGSGKTTLLRAIAGLLTPTAAKVSASGATWIDTKAGTNIPAHKRRTGYVFQEPRLFPHMSVERNITYGARRPGLRPDLSELVDVLALQSLLDRSIAGLSGGEAQRVSLARALYSAPSVLLLDEPLSALDRNLKQDILPFLERMRSEFEIPVIYVSHDLNEVTRLADRMIVLDDGRKIGDGPIGEVLATSDPNHRASRLIAGGLLTARISAFDTDHDLTEVRVGEISLWLPGRVGAIGSSVRLRLDAGDITLSLGPPAGLSALNVLPTIIESVTPGPGSGALVRLNFQGTPLAARITRKSVGTLGLLPGQSVHAVLKSMTVGAERVGSG